jgi:DNA-binding MarR family transcriptional regulator
MQCHTGGEFFLMQDDRIIYLLAMAHLAVRAHIGSEFLREGIKVTLPQATVLFLLQEKDGRMLSEIGQVLGVDNSAVTGFADRLEKAGYVTRMPNPGDRRAWHLHITPQGRDEAQRASGIVRRVNAEAKAGFSEQDIEGFKNVLKSFHQKFRK